MKRPGFGVGAEPFGAGAALQLRWNLNSFADASVQFHLKGPDTR